MKHFLKLAALSASLATFMAACNSSAPAPTPTAPQAEVQGIDLDNLKSAAVGSDAYLVGQALSAQQGPLKKLDFALSYLSANRDTNISAQSAGDQRIVVDALASGSGSELLSALTALGLEHGAVFGRNVSGTLPISALSRVASLESLKFIRATRAASEAGLVQSQGDAALGAALARNTYGLSGAGVTVGILSDSMNKLAGTTTYAQDIANGDLPAGGVNILEDLIGGGGIDEGRAMAQIIHDVAPGAALAFHSAFNGEANFAQGIIDLKNAGAKVIVDDIRYFDEPFFQDGIIAQAVDTVKAAGVSYFASQGNYADRSYEGTFKPSFRRLNGETLNDFSGGDVTQGITVPNGGSLIAILQWDDPFASSGPDVPGGIQITSPGASTDLNLYVTNATGSFVMPPIPLLNPNSSKNPWIDGVFPPFLTTLSTDNNIGANPVEIVEYQNTSGSTLSLGIAVTHKSGPLPKKFKIVYIRATGGTAVNEYNTQSGTGFGHSNAAGAFATGAARYDRTPAFGVNPPLLESFSSKGGVPIYFDKNGVRLAGVDLRAKPDAVSVDGGNTTFFAPGAGQDYEGDGFPNFFGTSAAAPHAAAVAALMKQAQPSLTPDNLYSALKTTALDMLTPGFDFLSGAGLIQADAAVASIATSQAALAQTIDFEDILTPFNDAPYGTQAILTSYSKLGYNFTSSTNTLYGLKGYELPTEGFLGGNILTGSVLRIAKPANAAFNLFSLDYTVFKRGPTTYPGIATVKGFFTDGTTRTRGISYFDPVQPLKSLKLNWFDLVKVEIDPGTGGNPPVIDNVKVQDR